MKKLFTVGFLLLASLSLSFAQYNVSGVIIDADDNQPLVGVAVVIQGTTTGTETDLDGKYSLEVPTGKSIEISYMGYEPQTKKVTGSGTVNVKMTLNVNELDEVVAIGYGTMKKSDLTGAVSSVKPEQLKKSPASGVDQALQGRVAGVTVNASSGQPGASAEVRIRGIGTVNDSRPIYVVDGLITNEISFLSPEDIETTEILKDASATAIYGSRGANGVVLITTKRGKEGKANISFNAYWGVQNRWNKLDLMGSKEMAETKMRLNPQASQIAYYNNRGFNDWVNAYLTGNSPYFPAIKSNGTPDGVDYSSIETDWQDEVFRKNALIQNYHLSLDGGNEKSRYAFSASYFNQDGTIIGSNYERLSLRINSTHQMRKWLKIGENLSFVNTKGRNAMNNSDSPGASVLSAALAMAPWDPTHYPDGAANKTGKDLSGQIAASSNFKNAVNPFSMVQNQHPTNKGQRWVGNIFADIQPIKDIVWHSSIGIDVANNEDKTFKDAFRYSSFDYQDRNFLAIDLMRYQTLSWENTLTYSKQIQKHNFSIMLGQAGEEWNYYKTGGSGTDILNPEEINWYLKNTTVDTLKSRAGDDVNRTRMFSLLGRAFYSYNNRYIATVTLRADATSKFPLNTWGYFPSTALAWRINEEGFLKDFKNLDNLKLRVGWGQIGNEKVDQNAARLNISQGSNIFTGYPFGANQNLAHGAAVLSYVDEYCKWETTETWNFGLDFGFYRGLISGTVELFNRDTKEMLIGVTAPAFVGNRFDPVANVGTVRNQGIEITLEHHRKIGEWDYTVGGNVSFVKNELTALNGGSPVFGDRVKSDEGLPLYTIWGYEYEGVYRSDDEVAQHLWASTGGFHAGDAKFKDLNNDGQIDESDKTNLGNPFPWLTYSLNLGVDFKGFDLQVFFQGVYGNKIYNAVRHRTEGTGNEATLSTTMRDVWIDYTDIMKASMESRGVDWTTLVNPDGSIPNPLGSPMNKETSSRFVENGAYLRLKNIQLGYTLPIAISKKAYIERCRIYVSANNLLTFTKYTGYDPEIGSGVDYGNYPQARTFTFGLNLNF